MFDALPVHVIKRQQGQLFEIMITMEEDELIEKAVPLANDQIIRFLEEYRIHIIEGHRMEIPLQMQEMISSIEKVLAEGMIISVDYGYTNEEWQEPIRRDGSLRGYYQHKLDEQCVSSSRRNGYYKSYPLGCASKDRGKVWVTHCGEMASG